MLFAGERHENQASPKVLARLDRRLRHLDDGRRAGGVVVGAVVDLPAAALRHREPRAAAEVVVVRADDDDFGLRRGIAAFEHADDVANGTA